MHRTMSQRQRNAILQVGANARNGRLLGARGGTALLDRSLEIATEIGLFLPVELAREA